MSLDRIMRVARPYAAAYLRDRIGNGPLGEHDMRPHDDRDAAAMFLAGLAHARMSALLHMPDMTDDEIDDALTEFPRIRETVGVLVSPPVTTRQPPHHHRELMFQGAVRTQPAQPK